MHLDVECAENLGIPERVHVIPQGCYHHITAGGLYYIMVPVYVVGSVVNTQDLRLHDGIKVYKVYVHHCAAQK